MLKPGFGRFSPWKGGESGEMHSSAAAGALYVAPATYMLAFNASDHLMRCCPCTEPSLTTPRPTVHMSKLSLLGPTVAAVGESSIWRLGMSSPTLRTPRYTLSTLYYSKVLNTLLLYFSASHCTAHVHLAQRSTQLTLTPCCLALVCVYGVHCCLPTAGLHAYYKVVACTITVVFVNPTSDVIVPPGSQYKVTVNVTAASSGGVCVPLAVTFSWSGDATVVGSSRTGSGSGQQQPNPGRTYDANIDNDNQAWIVLQSPGGSTVINVTAYDGVALPGGDVTAPGTITWAAEPPNPQYPATLLLYPYKAYRSCGEHATITATAADANGTAVPNATVAFTAFGDCHPDMEQHVVATDAQGQAAISISAREPGVVAVAAVVLGSAGQPIVAEAVHVIFYEEDRHYVDRREHEYFHGRRHHDDWDSE